MNDCLFLYPRAAEPYVPVMPWHYTSFWSGNAIIGVGTTEFWEWECNYGTTLLEKNYWHAVYSDYSAPNRLSAGALQV